MSKRESTDRAALDTALEEVIGRAAAPDLSERIMRAAESKDLPTRNRSWLTAAIVLLAASIVVMVAVFHQDAPVEEPIDGPETGTEQETTIQDPDAKLDRFQPKTVPEALRWLDGVDKLTLRLDGVWAHTSKRLVKLNIGWSLFSTPGRREVTHEDEVYRYANALKSVISSEAAEAIGWDWQRAYAFELLLTKGKRSMAVQMKYRSTDGICQLRIGELEFALRRLSENNLAIPLTKEFDRLVDSIASLGIITGDDDIEKLPPDQHSIRAYDISGMGLRQLAQHRQIKRLDLRGSPEAIRRINHFTGTSLPKPSKDQLLNGIAIPGISDRRFIVFSPPIPSVEVLILDSKTCGKIDLGTYQKMMPNLVDFIIAPASWNPRLFLFTLLTQAARGPVPTRFDDEAAERLAGFEKLKRASLFASIISDRGVKSLSKARALEQLYIHSEDITGLGFSSFSADSNLRELSLSGSWATPDGIAAIAALPIKRLRLLNTHGTVRALSKLVESRSIQRLVLFGPQFIADDKDAWRETLPELAKIETLEKMSLDCITLPIKALEAFRPKHAGFKELILIRVAKKDEAYVEALGKAASFRIRIETAL